MHGSDKRRRWALVAAQALLAGTLATGALAPAAAAGAQDTPRPESVPAQETDKPVPDMAEPTLGEAPEVTWPEAAHKTVDLSPAGASRGDAARAAAPAAEVSAVTLRPARRKDARTAQSPPSRVDVRVLGRKKAEAVGGLGLGLRVARRDGGQAPGDVEVSIDYSGFEKAYGGDFGARLRLMEFPSCALATPEAPGCSDGTYVPADNDTHRKALTATVEAAPQTTQRPGRGPVAEPMVYVLTSGSSSDEGDYRASTLSPTGQWDVSLGSGAFTYSVPIDVPKPPMGVAPELGLNYNSQAIDGRTSASNNQASWAGMGWDLEVGYIERRYRNCTKDGHPTFGDLCWDSPNSGDDPNGAVYVINLGGTTSELIQDGTGSGSFHLKDDPGWRVQKLNGGYGSDNTDEFWVVTHQDGTRYYFGWGRSERTGTRTDSVLTVPVIGDDVGEPCHGSFPDPCNQAWRWNLDRVVTSNEVENSYFYDKEKNHYRSVAAADRAREYDASSYLKRIEYGWSSQTTDGQLPAKVEFQHLNRCVERLTEKDPLDNVTPTCPTIESQPESYPDVPVDLICRGPDAGETCAGKTYHPTFFQRDLLWDIKTYVRDNDSAAWDLVTQYQMKYALMNPPGSVDAQLWLDYIQRRGYSGTDITLPTLNFNGEWQDNLVGSGELNFRRVGTVYTDTGSTVSVTYGHATDEGGTVSRQCDASNLPSQSDNHYECFWQKWKPEGADEAKTGWFKKFVVTRVVVDPGDLSGAPSMTTTYEYDGAPGWRFTGDPLTDDSDESWTEWRGYGRVLVTTGANANRHSTYHWLYRGLDGDRTSKSDPSQTRSVTVKDSVGDTWTDYAWFAGRVLETSTRNAEGISQQRAWHEYWTHNTAQYVGLPDARFVREKETRTLQKISTSTADMATWRETVVQREFEDDEAASTTFGLPLRVDEWGETGVSDNRCTEYGRAYNTSQLDSTGTDRWMVFLDDQRHYSVSCTQQAEDQAAGQDTLHQDRRVVTFFDGAATFTENNTALVDGNPTEKRTYTDAASHRTTKAGFDAAGRMVKAWDGNNALTTTTYSPANSWPVDGVRTTRPDPDGAGPGQPLTGTAYVSRFWGEPWKTVDAEGNATRAAYDAAGRLIKVFQPAQSAQYPDGNPTMEYRYHIPVAPSADAGVPDVATGEPVRVTTRTLQSGSTYAESVLYADGLGREHETQVPSPTGDGRMVTVTRYDSSGNVAGTSAAFHSEGQAGSGAVNPLVSDIPSYKDLIADWAGRTTLSQIQALGVAQATNRTVTTYDGADLTSVVTGGGAPTKTYKDVFGQTRKVIEQKGASTYTTRYEFTRSGKLKYVHDALGNTTHYRYNWAGERVEAQSPDSGTSTTAYDDNGQVISTTDGAGTTLEYEYDALGRRTATKHDGTLLQSKSYDTAPGGKGKLASAVSYDGGEAYTTTADSYDANGRSTSVTVTVPDDGSGLEGSYTFGYHFDAAGHRTAIDYPALGGLPAETVTTEYDAQGRVRGLSGDLGTYLSDVGYDSVGRLASRSFGTPGGEGSVHRTFGYDDTNGTGWLRNITTEAVTATGTEQVQDDTFVRDDIGQLTSRRDNVAGQQECFRYDDLKRLTDAWTTAGTACGPGEPQSDFAGVSPYQRRYAYDALGNIRSVTDITASGATTKEYSYAGYSADGQSYTPDQPRPHAVTRAGEDTYGYDDAGRMTSRTVDGVQADITWSPQGRVDTITRHPASGDEQSGYVYDGEGKVLLRTSPEGAVLYVDGHELRADEAGKVTATRHYAVGSTPVAIRVADGSEEGLLTWLLGDAQASSVLAVTLGGVFTRRRYMPFGKQRGDTALPEGTDRGFLGKPEDASTGLSLLGPRMYDPAIGRFLSPDPATGPEIPQTLNTYSYGRNNPVNYTDASGLFPFSDYIEEAWDATKLVLAQGYVEAVDRVGHAAGFTMLAMDPVVRATVPEAVMGTRADPTPIGVGWEWATNTGPKNREMDGDDRFTQTLKEHYHVQETRTLIARDIQRGALDVGEHGSSDHSLGKGGARASLSKLYRDFTTNSAAAFLGSYTLDYEVVAINRKDGTATVRFSVENDSTITSAFRPPPFLGGYGKWWQKHVSEPLEKVEFRAGVMSKKHQSITWTETIRYSGGSASRSSTSGGGGGGGFGGIGALLGMVLTVLGILGLL